MDSGLGIRYEGRDGAEGIVPTEPEVAVLFCGGGLWGLWEGESGELLEKRYIVNLGCVGQAWDLGVLFYLMEVL